jgi:hypothetical protein
MFLVGLGHTPTTTTEHGFAGLTNEQAYLAISASAAMAEIQMVGINNYLHNALAFVTAASSGPV